ncbi:hypothetical protein VCUG_01649 [Vavraia culicis subsp. floridensis]|uniref:Uncharacterized protein n=1 Tax=Vavraia culicis (isolate floridensis) TaxID=948595 RepID=L2GUX2_VAVCU|nr:uncharacterized protein VCUG_01649 [Vavraia culicis subsp. floridensis]ELA46875.1 hypothetical protein VCUG_01649 [Vavraia culicis subsp. floridensis]
MALNRRCNKNVTVLKPFYTTSAKNITALKPFYTTSAKNITVLKPFYTTSAKNITVLKPCSSFRLYRAIDVNSALYPCSEQRDGQQKQAFQMHHV